MLEVSETIQKTDKSKKIEEPPPCYGNSSDEHCIREYCRYYEACKKEET